jgi:hypothetical protein
MRHISPPCIAPATEQLTIPSDIVPADARIAFAPPIAGTIRSNYRG